MDESKQAEVEAEVISLVTAEKEIDKLRTELMEADERFRNFLQKEKDHKENSKIFWDTILTQMNKYSLKSIKGDWGSVTVVEKIGSWKVDMEILPKKFIKKVADNKKLSDTFKLTNKLPDGAEPVYSNYLMKRIK